MKKLLLPVLLFFSYFATAQEIEVVKTEQLSFQQDANFAWAEFVPETNFLLVSKQTFKGLYLINTKTKAIKQIVADAGAGHKPAISADGTKIVYKNDSFKGKLKYSELKEYDLKTNKNKLLVNKTRHVSSPAFSGSQLVYFKSGEQKKTNVNVKATKKNEIVVQTENLKPFITSKVGVKKYMPSGEGNYIWVSLSPDKTKMVYNFNGRETLISDLNGNILAKLGHFHAPQWLNNNILIGMNDKDNGEVITSSEIVSYSLKKRITKKLTNTSNRIELYPAVSLEAKQIAFQTNKGEIFIMNIVLK